MDRSTASFLQFQNPNVSLFICWQNLARNAVMLCLVFISPTEMGYRNQLCLIICVSGGSVIAYLALRVGLYLNLRTVSNICSLSIGLPFK